MPSSSIPAEWTPGGAPLCSCWRLMHILGPDDVLPDHVCTVAMAGSVLRWQYERGAPLPDLDQLAGWPVQHVDGRPIMLVVRQRVAEEENKWLQSHFARNAEWRLLVLTIHLCRFFKGALAGVDGEMRQLLHRGAEGDERALGQLLRRERLPDTPSLRRHLWACVVGEPGSAQPVREGTVTTLVFGRVMPGMRGYPLAWQWHEEQRRSWPLLADPRDVPEWFPREASGLALGDGNARTSFDFETALWSAELYKRASPVIQAHREWSARWCASSLPDRRMKARLLGGYVEPRTLDYVEEALHEDHMERLEREVRHQPWALDHIITEHCNATGRVLGDKRKEAGLPRTPEAGWRDKVRPVIRARLLAVLVRESNAE